MIVSRANHQERFLKTVTTLFFAGSLLLGSCSQAPHKPSADLIIQNGIVLTLDEGDRIFSPGCVVVTGDTLADVGPMDLCSRYDAKNRLDATGQYVMPGLVNGHQHAAMVLFRGMAEDLPLKTWLEKHIFPAEAEFVDPEFVYWGTLLAAAEMLSRGTTTFADMYYFEEQAARAVTQAGIRAVLGQTVLDFPAPDFETPEAALAATEEFALAWQGHPLVTPAVAPHSPYTCSEETLKASQNLAQRYGLPILIHLAETQDEVELLQREKGWPPISYLNAIGFLSPAVVAAHVVWPNEEEVELLARHRVGVIHNPESNMKLASGVAPIAKLMSAGVVVGLGTDGPVSNNNLDLFQEMDTMVKLQKLVHLDSAILSARDAVRAATIGSASALGIQQQVGSLEIGKKADLILVRAEGLGAEPAYEPYGSLVYTLDGHDVGTVVVGGEIVLKNGRFSNLDVNEVLVKSSAIADRIKAAINRN